MTDSEFKRDEGPISDTEAVVSMSADLSETACHELLNNQFVLLRKLRSDLPIDAATFPAKGSSLAGDDRWTEPYQISHYVRLLLGVANDQLHALDNLINGTGTVHPYACSPLIRAAIENACMAYWLMDGATRRERATRLFCLHWDGVNKRFKFQTAAPALGGDDDRGVRQTRLIELAGAHGINPQSVRQQLKITDVVKEVEAGIETGFSISGAWNIFSGVTHGQQWAILTLLDRQEERDAGGDLVNALLSIGLRQIVWGVGCASAVIDRATDRLLQRGASMIEIA